MKSGNHSASAWAPRAGASLLFLCLGSLIILVFSPWRPLIQNRIFDYLGRIVLVAGLFGLMVLVSRGARVEKYRQLLAGLFIMAVAVSLDWVFGNFLQRTVGVSDVAPSGWAMIKLNEGFIIISTILVLNRLTGGSLGSIYIQRGNLKLGLTIGIVTFLLAAAGSIPMASLFQARDISLPRIVPWIPWLLIYVLVNAALEELMFRGLFLRKLEPFLGKFFSNLATAFVFTGLHGTVTYSADNLIFVAVTFPLALAWGHIMQKTDSIWGSIVFHAGMDIPIMLGIFSNL